jgi:hypothetical protein
MYIYMYMYLDTGIYLESILSYLHRSHLAQDRESNSGHDLLDTHLETIICCIEQVFYNLFVVRNMWGKVRDSCRQPSYLVFGKCCIGNLFSNWNRSFTLF